jgi:hypothetical protein
MNIKLLLENLKERGHSEDLSVDDNDIRMDLREIRWEVVEWMQLAQDRDQLRALVNTVRNLRLPLRERNFLTN